jgi:glyoxylase-like metal-dependent hydrolase (beta-lactamase superfamily II)
MDLAEFRPGVPVEISPGVRRVVAPNASAMTGPGTNSYVLGAAGWAVIDPGPDDPRHAAALLAIAPAPRWIFVTHTHRDHSPLAQRLAAATGAQLVGRPGPPDGRQDTGFRPDIIPQRDQRFEATGAKVALRAIDTPGHASNHICYLLEPEGLLFSGDHILDGMTPVILAPDGDMQHYLEALRRLRELPLAAIAPGHGRLLREPQAVIDALVAHRLRREAKVIAALASQGSAELAALLEVVYADTPRTLHALARLTLEAHLIKLMREGRAGRDGDRWVGV